MPSSTPILKVDCQTVKEKKAELCITFDATGTLLLRNIPLYYSNRLPERL